MEIPKENFRISPLSQFRTLFARQEFFTALRGTFAILAPAFFLVYTGHLAEYFALPLGTSIIVYMDSPGPFIRRRNALLFGLLLCTCTVAIGLMVHGHPMWVFLFLLILSLPLSMLGLYGNRLSAVGGLSLLSYSLFSCGNFGHNGFFLTLSAFFIGGLLYIMVLFIGQKMQPHKLSQQLVSENFKEIAALLRLHVLRYGQNTKDLQLEIIKKQIEIKDLQEQTREILFKTREIIKESTTQGRLLMFCFLQSIDIHEKLFTSDGINKNLETLRGYNLFETQFQTYLSRLAFRIEELSVHIHYPNVQMPDLYQIQDEEKAFLDEYQQFKNSNEENPQALGLKQLSLSVRRIKELSLLIRTCYEALESEKFSAKALSTGLDVEKFVPESPKLNHKLFLQNLSLKSFQFRFAVRQTVALLLGYSLIFIPSFPAGHVYWVLITILTIIRPDFSISKDRNIKRLLGTIGGACTAYAIIVLGSDSWILVASLMAGFFCYFILLRFHYGWAVFSTTISVFITFNFLHPGIVNQIFVERLVDTLIGGLIAYVVSYFLLPNFEKNLTKKKLTDYLEAYSEYWAVISKKISGEIIPEHHYRLVRKNAFIALANFSDSFQKMMQEPSQQQRKLKMLHQLVNLSHLQLSYTTSFYQLKSSDYNKLKESDLANAQKVNQELAQSLYWSSEKRNFKFPITAELLPTEEVTENMRKDPENPQRQLLHLIIQTSLDQRKIIEKNYSDATTIQ